MAPASRGGWVGGNGISVFRFPFLVLENGIPIAWKRNFREIPRNLGGGVENGISKFTILPTPIHFKGGPKVNHLPSGTTHRPRQEKKIIFGIFTSLAKKNRLRHNTQAPPRKKNYFHPLPRKNNYFCPPGKIKKNRLRHNAQARPRKKNYSAHYPPGKNKKNYG